MDPLYPFNSWPNPAWPQGPWYLYPPTSGPGDFLDPLPQVQQTGEEEMHEMKAFTPLVNMQPLPSHLNWTAPQQDQENTPPTPPSPSSSTDSSYGHFSCAVPHQSANINNASLTPPWEGSAFDEKAMVAFEPMPPSCAFAAAGGAPPTQDGAEGEAVPPAKEASLPPPEKKRGQKRKRVEEDEDGQDPDQNKIAPSTPFSPSSIATTTGPDANPTFCEVVGRLSIVGNSRSYRVSINEIHRRTGLPEGLTKSIVGPLLRRGKISKCGNDLQELLESRGLSSRLTIPVNRKRVPITTLTALLEGEAMQISSDHEEIMREHFPTSGFAKILVRSFKSPPDLCQGVFDVKMAKLAVSECASLLEEWTKGGWEKGADSIVHTPLREFSLKTHGLGVDEMLLMTSLLSQYLAKIDEEMIALMEKLRAATNGDPRAFLMPMYPQGLEIPEIPPGHLYIPDNVEEACASISFSEIPGRLSLNNRKYNVTVGEIYRRLRAPESLNLSILGSLLRKGKTKSNCKQLQDDLKDRDIEIDSGRRKSAKVTTFTALAEGEAIKLALDVDEEMTALFPFLDIALTLVSSPSFHVHDISARRAAYAHASHLAGALEDAVRQLQLPVAERIPNKQNPFAYLILNYSSLTHGYGPDAVIAWMRGFKKLFDIISKEMAKLE